MESWDSTLSNGNVSFDVASHKNVGIRGKLAPMILTVLPFLIHTFPRHVPNVEGVESCKFTPRGSHPSLSSHLRVHMFKVSKEASAVFHTWRANWWKCNLGRDQLIFMAGVTFSGRVKFFFFLEKKLSGIIYISPIAANFFSTRGFLDAPRNTFHIIFHI